MESKAVPAEDQPQASVLEYVSAPAVATDYQRDQQVASEIRAARLKGYEGDMCPECGQFTMVRNGTCLKCVTCGATSGCS